jgi:hypothetical protein
MFPAPTTSALRPAAPISSSNTPAGDSPSSGESRLAGSPARTAVRASANVPVPTRK